MAFRQFQRRGFRRRRTNPLRRWTAETFQAEDSAVVGAGATLFTSQSVALVTRDTYRQNIELEPDGATILRVIAKITHQVFVIENGAVPYTEPFTFRLNWVFYVAADNIVGQFPTQMLIDSRVLHFGQASGNIGRDSVNVAGNTRVEPWSANGNLWPTVDVDFNVRARLKQQDQLWLTLFWGFLNSGANQNEMAFSSDVLARVLIGGRF